MQKLRLFQAHCEITLPYSLWSETLFRCSVVSNFSQPHTVQHARLLCPPSHRVGSDSWPSSRWCHPTISSSAISFSFPSIRVFSNESALHMRWPNYWSFSFNISSSNEYSELILLRVDCFDLLALRDSQESSPAPRFKSNNSLVLSLLYGPILTSIHDYWKNHSFD